MPDGLREWYEDFAAKTGKAVNAVLVAALEEFRSRHDGATAPPAPAPRGTTASRKPRPPKAAPAARENGPEGAEDIAAFFRHRNGEQ